MLAKRVTDLLLALSLLILFAPVLAGCALLLRLLEGPPVLFRQQRVGRALGGFSILKFRTMRPQAGGLVTAAGDPRVTPLGRVLRRWKLDELPQLWNVVRGEMSLVGPRPEVPYYVERHQRAYRHLTRLRPGITDWSSLIFRDEERVLARHADDAGFYERELLPRKVALGRLYLQHRSWLVDSRILLATLLTLTGPARLAQAALGARLRARARAGLEP